MKHKIHEDEIKITQLDNGYCHIEIFPTENKKITIKDAHEQYCTNKQTLNDGEINRLKRNWKGNMVTINLEKGECI